LAIIALVASYAAAPVVGRWVTTANASTVSAASGPGAVYSPANDDNDNQYEDCGTGNPRKDKKCHYNTPNVDNDNADNDGNGPISGDAPVTTLEISNADPQRGETLRYVAVARGSDLDQISWWVTDYSNRDAPFLTNNEAHNAACDGSSYCQQYVEITAGNEGTFTFHAKSRDRHGRESNESAVQIRVH